MNGALATAVQLAAEQQAIRVLAMPEIQAAIAVERKKLLADPVSATAEGRAELENALVQWTVHLIMREVAIADAERPKLLWTSDGTPHHWFGHTFPGSEWGANSPDNIYRRGYVDGAYRYEVRGKRPANAPMLNSLLLTTFEKLERWTAPKPGSKVTGLEEIQRDGSASDAGKATFGFMMPHETIAVLSGPDLKSDPDGNFVVTLDTSPANGRSNHMQLRQGLQWLTFRDSLSDWSQHPVPFEIRRIDISPAGPVPDDAEIAQLVVADLPGWAALCSSLKDTVVMGPVNTLAGPYTRDGGWQSIGGARFDLSDEEALVVTLVNSKARYVGMQISGHWLMTPDSRRHITSLNNAQAVAARNGETTYIISAKDPGVANWLDTGGAHQGVTIIRWDGLPPHTDQTKIVKTFRVIRLSDLRAELPPDTTWVTPEQRKEQIAQRTKSYDLRLVN